MKTTLAMIAALALCVGCATVTSSETVQDVLRRHAHFIRLVQSCEKRNWPVTDPACEGAALGLAHDYVQDHPEWFGPDALKDEKP